MRKMPLRDFEYSRGIRDYLRSKFWKSYKRIAGNKYEVIVITGESRVGLNMTGLELVA